MFEDVDANASAFVNIHVVDSMSEIRPRTQGGVVKIIAHRVRKVILGAEKLKRERMG